MKHTAPSTNLTAFNCPHCDVLSQHKWFKVGTIPIPNNPQDNIDLLNIVSEISYANASGGAVHLKGLLLSECTDCDQFSIWISGQLAHPNKSSAPLPNSDMPDEIKRDYLEASSILNTSPRGAAALLRLAIQKLCIELGQKGKNINNDIAALVKAGLNVHVQKALDSVRVIGNEAVHPGVIDLRDDKETAGVLFVLINFIIEKMISEPKAIDAIYGSLPESKREGIENRDKPDDG